MSGRKQKAKKKLLGKKIFTEERKERSEWENLFRELSNEDREYYYRYLRMSPEHFKHLFNLVDLLIAKRDKNYRRNIQQKKAFLLRFVI